MKSLEFIHLQKFSKILNIDFGNILCSQLLLNCYKMATVKYLQLIVPNWLKSEIKQSYSTSSKKKQNFTQLQQVPAVLGR